MRRDLQVRLDERRASGTLCAVSHCPHPVHNIGRYCRHHDNVDKRTGHPLGRTITEREVKSYRDLARSFIDRHQDHPGIKAGVDWLQRLVRHAVEPNTVTVNTPPQSRANQWLAKMNREGVDPADMLAIIVAMHVLQEIQPRLFRSDRHFKHQLITRFLRLTGAPMRPNGKHRQTVSVKMSQYLAGRLISALGLLVWKIKDQLIRDMSRPDPDAAVAGVNTPFNNINNTDKEG